MFEGYTNLASVTLPESVTHIGAFAFLDCSALADITYAGTKAQWNNAHDDIWSTYYGDYVYHRTNGLHCTDGNSTTP